jgi:hypothetical protein
VREEEIVPEVGDDKWGRGVRERREEKGVPVRICLGMGRGLIWSPPASFSFFISFYFSFSFSGFLFYFKSFANLIQNNSNKFLKSSNIHYSVLYQ